MDGYDCYNAADDENLITTEEMIKNLKEWTCFVEDNLEALEKRV